MSKIQRPGSNPADQQRFFEAIIRKLSSLEDRLALQEAVFSTWVNYTPVYTPLAPMTFSSVTTSVARYLDLGTMYVLDLVFNGTIGGTPSSYLDVSLPIAAMVRGVEARFVQPAGGVVVPITATTAGSVVSLYKSDLTAYASDTLEVRVFGLVRKS